MLIIICEGPVSPFHHFLSPGCSLSPPDGIWPPQLSHSGQNAWRARPFWTLVAILRIFHLVGPLVLEDTEDTVVYPLPFYSLRLSCWSTPWQETSLSFSSRSFLFSFILKEGMRMLSSPTEKQGSRNTSVSLGNRYVCYWEALMCSHTWQLQVILSGNRAKFELLCFLMYF